MKRNLLETLNTPITGQDVKRVLHTPLFARKDSASSAAQTGTLSVQETPNGLKLEKARHYELGPGASLVRLTFDDHVEVIELLPEVEGCSFAARLWNRDGWPTVVIAQLDVAQLEGSGSLKVFKDSTGSHAYFTLVWQSARELPQRPIKVVRAASDEHADSE